MSEKGSDSIKEIFDNDQGEKIEEYLLNVLMETIPDTIYFKDSESRFIKVNKSQSKFLGLEKPEDAVGKTDFDFFDPEHSQAALADEQRIIQSKEPVLGKVEKIRKSDGTVRYMSATKVPMYDGKGKVIGIAGISRDVTERKVAEDRLELLAQKLTQSNKELENFASIASHDLQEPLRKVQAFGSRLKTKYAAGLPPEGLDYLERMLSATDRMQILINDLLKFSRVSTREYQFDTLDLNAVMADVISDLEIRIEQTQGEITVAPLPVIEADKSLMRQLFQNLIGNALKFHREDVPPVINITNQVIERTESPDQSDYSSGEFCEISIEDNGIGFEEEYSEKIFAIFQRLHGREKYEGTGIGLATCRKIAERHQGSINVSSKLGEGSKFIITLPLKHRAF
jgi:two-component system sensor kinase FixL